MTVFLMLLSPTWSRFETLNSEAANQKIIPFQIFHTHRVIKNIFRYINFTTISKTTSL